MSERITARNLPEVVARNREIHMEICQKANIIRTKFNTMQVNSAPQLAIQLLKNYGLIQIPIDNPYLSGAIFVRDNIKIPVINTALPRTNQYFTAWHEIYHLFFDEVSFDHIIASDALVEERKAEYFASLMLLGNLMPYFSELPELDFLSKIFYCMDVFQAPYKAILISLYESANKLENTDITSKVLDNFDLQFSDLAQRFRSLGLDDTLVKPSYIVNVSSLQAKMNIKAKRESDVSYHNDNIRFLNNIVKEIHLITGDIDA